MYGANPYHGVLRILYKLESDFYRNDRNKNIRDAVLAENDVNN